MDFAARRVYGSKRRCMKRPPSTFDSVEVATEPNCNMMLLRLGKEFYLGTGDPIECERKYCAAVFSCYSKTTEMGNGESQWICEFCGHENIIDINPEEVPSEHTVDYLLEAVEANRQDESIIIYCLDISGSMCVTQVVDKSYFAEEKNVYDDLPAELLLELGVDIQQLRDERVHTISRIQAAQAAIESQLEALNRDFPNRRVALVTFNNEVSIVGDGTQNPINIVGDRLLEYDRLLAIGKEYQIASTISESKAQLTSKLMAIKESGATALGPALLVSVALASQCPGSKVIITTDGLANIGLGSFENMQAAEKFYQDVGKLASSNGVTVSVVSISGSDCRVENLGEVAQLTGGDVQVVDPTQLEGSFSAITKNPLIGTNVHLQLSLSRHLYLSGPLAKEFTQTTPKDDNPYELQLITKIVNNAFEDTEIAVQYAVKSELPENLKEVPFQARIQFNAPNGNKYLRVITSILPLSTDIQDASKDVDVAVFSAVVGQVNAALAQQGEYSSALQNARANRAFLADVVETDNAEQARLLNMYDEQLKDISNVLHNQMEVDVRSSNPHSIRMNRLDHTAVELHHLRQAEKAACSIM